MARPDPALLDPARYPFQCMIETRYRDLDSNLHLNNGVLACLLEEGRVRFHRKSQYNQYSADERTSAMVASLALEYLGEIQFPEPLEISTAFARIGNTSYDLVQLVMQEGRVVAFARVTMVNVREGAPDRISDERRGLTQQWMLKA